MTEDTIKMTHDEMIDVLKGLVFGTFDRTTAKEREALDMAIQTLEQESRIGHWIDDDDRMGRSIYICSECNEYADKFIGGTEDWWDLEKPNYCPNCGAKMEIKE